MPIEKKTIRLLILEDSQNEAERLVSLFRNSGRATRVHRLTSREDLEDVLTQNWDLLIAAPSSDNLDPGEALTIVRRQAKDLPVIQLTADNESDTITEALMLGAQNALPQGDDERLVLVANRELECLEDRRGRRNAEMALREAEKRCQLLLDSSVDAITYVHDGMHIYANRAYMSLFGHDDQEELQSTPVVDLIAPSDQQAFKDFLKRYQDDGATQDLSCTGLRADGERFPSRITLSPASYDGEPCIQIVIRVETSNSDLEERLREIATQDPVTGLFNRSHFIELVDQAGDRAINAGMPACLCYIRIVHYAGHLAEIGISGTDQLLGELAPLLRRAFPQETHLARFGDDVIAALQPGATPEQFKPALASILHDVESHLFEINERTVQLSLSVGMAGISETTREADLVIDRAHRCADEAADGDGVRIKLYDPTQELAAAANRGNVEALIQHALETDGFRLLFQPIISLRGDPAENYEVLLRLIAPQGHLIEPEEFIEVAKTAGLADRIDRWVIQQATRMLVEHRNKGHNTRLFIHLSSNALQDRALLAWLSDLLKREKLPPENLVFQICEPDAVTYLKQAKLLCEGLREIGCRTALDQFGCAINPFNTLKHMDVGYVKIDPTYASDLGSKDNQEALKALLAGLQAQSRLTIMPFVESASILATLWQAGVNYIQGFYLQEPRQSMDYDFSSGEE